MPSPGMIPTNSRCGGVVLVLVVDFLVDDVVSSEDEPHADSASTAVAATMVRAIRWERRVVIARTYRPGPASKRRQLNYVGAASSISCGISHMGGADRSNASQPRSLA